MKTIELFSKIIFLKGTYGEEVITQNFKKVRFLRNCHKNSKIFSLQQFFSIVKITINLRRSLLIFKSTTGPLFESCFSLAAILPAVPAHPGNNVSLNIGEKCCKRVVGVLSWMCLHNEQRWGLPFFYDGYVDRGGLRAEDGGEASLF